MALLLTACRICMAIRLSKALGSTPEAWSQMQLAYDLAAARKNEKNIKVQHYQGIDLC